MQARCCARALRKLTHGPDLPKVILIFDRFECLEAFYGNTTPRPDSNKVNSSVFAVQFPTVG